MIEQVYDKIYRSEIPLPNNPLKSLNSYIIKGKEKTIIIDTGFNDKECKEAFYNNLKALDIDISSVEVIITHLHSDHSGLAQELYQGGARILMSRGDGEATTKLKADKTWSEMGEKLKTFGLKVGENFLDQHPGKIYAPLGDFEFTVLKEGDQIVVDDYSFEVISVPGHTPDMINLFEPTHGIYFSGDHVLDPITPNIGFWGFEYPVILDQYFGSLKKIYNFKIKLMLPSHRKLITNHQRRIDELLEHHQHRLKEIEEILSQNGSGMTVEDVTKSMEWKITAKNWSDFPPPQKAFALGEAMSHLEYLAHKGRVTMREDNNIIYFGI